MRTVLIIEPHLGGHHLTYLEWLARGLRNLNIPCAVVTAKELEGHPALGHFKELLPEVPVLYLIDEILPTTGVMWLRALTNRFANARRIVATLHAPALKKFGKAFAFFPFLDLIGYQIALRPRLLSEFAWSGIFMAVTFHRSKPGGLISAMKSRVQEVLFRRLLMAPSLEALFVIDPKVEKYFESEASLRRKLHYFADPVDEPNFRTRSDARRWMGFQDSDVVLVVYGSLAARKGVEELLSAMQLTAWPDVKVILAGKIADSVASVLALNSSRRLIESGRVRVIDNYLSYDEEGLLFSGADFCWLGYIEFFQMSGVMVKSISYGVPIVASPWGVIGELARDLRLGPVLPDMSPATICEVMQRSLSTWRTHDVGDRLSAIAANHHVEKATRPVFDHLRAVASATDD